VSAGPILALDTATAHGSVAWLDPAGGLEVIMLGQRDHGRSLGPAVEHLCGGDPGRAQAFALAIGPGSFTGLRVGLSFLKGLGLVFPRPTFAIDTLEALVAAWRDESGQGDPVLAALDARQGEAFGRLDDEPLGMTTVAAILGRCAERPRGTWIGDPIAALAAGLPPGWVRGPWETGFPPRGLAGAIARLTAARLAAGRTSGAVELQLLEPAYGQPAAVDRARASG